VTPLIINGRSGSSCNCSIVILTVNLNKANPIDALVKAFEAQGNLQHSCPADADLNFTAARLE
jgi:hypothetical protein